MLLMLLLPLPKLNWDAHLQYIPKNSPYNQPYETPSQDQQVLQPNKSTCQNLRWPLLLMWYTCFTWGVK